MRKSTNRLGSVLSRYDELSGGPPTPDRSIHLTSERLSRGRHATLIIRNALPFSKRSVPFSNVDQCATLCEAVASDNRAKMKERKAYMLGTAASQSSQVRRLLSDLNTAT
jgi:hypothetical protein